MKLNLAEARQLLARAVENRGEEFVYDKDQYGGVCAYFDPSDGTPGCIVGQVLSFKGVTLETFINWAETYRAESDHTYAPNLNTSGVTDLVDYHFIDADNQTLEYLALAQSRQDTGATWGQALRRAEQYVEEIGA